MAQSFNIRPPEDVAFAYGFDKNRIAQAVADKKLDETSAVMAAMLINAGQRQQEMQAGQQPTVAQQVLGGGGAPAPLAANPAASAGMGALPPMPPSSSMPPQEMPQPEMAMAAGGLTTLPVPDAMFDEPTNGGFNDGYAGGGMVAFAGGGTTGGWGDYIEQTVRKLDPNIQITGRARTPERNAQLPGAVANSYHIIDAARDIRTPDGMKKSDFIAQLKSVFGPDYDVLPSAGNSVHVEPGPKLGEKVRGGMKASNAPAVMPERDIGTAEGRASSREDIFQSLQSRFGPTPEEQAVEDKRMARAEEMASPEYYEKQRKADMWETLTEIGVNMASKPIAEAIGAAMPGARAAKKERAALKDRALDAMGEINGLKRKENLQLFGMAVELGKEGALQEQFERKLASEETQSNLDRAAQLEGYKISAAGKTTDLESATQIIYESLVKSNAQGLLTKDGKPFTFAPEALKRQALVAAAKLVKPPKADTDVLGALQLGGAGGTGTGGSTVVDYGALEQ